MCVSDGETRVYREHNKIRGTNEWWTVGWYYGMIKDRATVIARGESRNSVTSDLRPIHPDDKNKMVI